MAGCLCAFKYIPHPAMIVTGLRTQLLLDSLIASRITVTKCFSQELAWNCMWFSELQCGLIFLHLLLKCWTACLERWYCDTKTKSYCQQTRNRCWLLTQNHENPRESNGYAIIWQGLYIWNPRCQHRYRANHSSLKMPWHSARYLVSTRGPEARPKESIELPNVQLPRLHLHPRHLHPPLLGQGWWSGSTKIYFGSW